MKRRPRARPARAASARLAQRLAERPSARAPTAVAGQTMMAIAWPAFLAACLLEFLVFALVDPADLHLAGHALALPRQAVYALGFFGFWIVAMGCSATTALLMRTPAQVNEQPGPAGSWEVKEEG